MSTIQHCRERYEKYAWKWDKRKRKNVRWMSNAEMGLQNVILKEEKK